MPGTGAILAVASIGSVVRVLESAGNVLSAGIQVALVTSRFIATPAPIERTFRHGRFLVSRAVAAAVSVAVDTAQVRGDSGR